MVKLSSINFFVIYTMKGSRQIKEEAGMNSKQYLIRL